MSTNGKRNRSAGNQYEREEAASLRESGLFPYAVTARSENRTRDGQKVDIVNKNEYENGRMEYDFQCKNAKGTIPYMKILDEMPKHPSRIAVVLHKHTVKSKSRFVAKGRFAIMRREDFFQLMAYRRAFEIVLREMGSMFTEGVIDELRKIGMYEDE